MKHAAESTETAPVADTGRRSAGWPAHQDQELKDCYSIQRLTPYTPGAHAKPFAKNHPATPVTYDAIGTTTPLVTAAPVLDVVA